MAGKEVAEEKQTAKKTPEPKTHSVKKGETFHGIATKYGLSFAKLKKMNDGSSKLTEGKSLNLTD